MLYRPTTRWQWTFVGINILQGATVAGLEIGIWLVLTNYGVTVYQAPPDLLLWFIGSIYKLVLVYDTLAKENTFQAIGLLLYNVFLCIFAGLDSTYQTHLRSGPWRGASSTAIEVIVFVNVGIVSISTLIECFVVWKLYDEYKWNLFKRLNADLALVRAYRAFQMLMAFLKFDLYFYLAYYGLMVAEAKYNAVDRTTGNPYTENDRELAKNAFLVPNAIFIPFAFFVIIGTSYPISRESVAGTLSILLCHLVLIAFVIYDLVRICLARTSFGVTGWIDFEALVAAATLILGVATVVVLVLCMTNFGRGLKPHLTASRRAMELELQNEERSNHVHHASPQNGPQGYEMLGVPESPAFESSVRQRLAASRPV